MTTDPKARADARLEAALQGADQADPRPLYRPALRHLKNTDETRFQRAIRYFEDELIPAVAGEADPLAAWLDYGVALGRAIGAGRLLELDTTGRSRVLEEAAAARGLVLYVPDDAGAPVLVIRQPREPSAAQRAAVELLAEGRQTASAYE